ncbi:MAG: alpha-L-fucosidase [Pirellulales bacterium]|nr:alpha-L-fucosidase [Pirellulales bacterium]
MRALKKQPIISAIILSLVIATIAKSEPDKKLTKLPGSRGVEVMESQPIIYKGRALLYHSRRPCKSLSPDEVNPYIPEISTYLYFEDIKTGEKLSPFGHGYSFGSAIARGDEMHVFATKDTAKNWTQDVYHFWSTDLKNWNKELAVARDGGEHLFNTSVCKEDQGYLITYESNVPVKWCTKFARSKDLKTWTKIEGLVFTGLSERPNGANSVIRYVKPYYYIIFGYGPIPGHFGWLTGIARSKDLVTWEMSPKNPMLEPRRGGDEGRNNTDADLCEIDGKTHIYYCSGDQATWGELREAVFPGTLKEFCESYFPAGVAPIKVSADWRRKGWENILVLPEGIPDPVRQPGSRTYYPEYQPPSVRQLRLQNWQLGAFLHFGLPTWAKTPEEYQAVYPLAPGMPDASRFDPKQLDAEQWVLTAKSFGAEYFIFTTKHHDGFCLWPTKTTEYCMRNVPWKNGEGDVVAEVARACRKHNMPLGLYCSPADKNAGCYSTWKRELVGDRDAYFLRFKQQLRELLTNYGEVVVVWLDNCLDPFGGDVVDPKTGRKDGSAHDRDIHALIHSLQPDAVITHPFCIRSEVLHPGNEKGHAPYPLWNVVRRGRLRKESWMLPESEGWLPAESNIHPRLKWIWTPGSDNKILGVEQLMRAYYTSIGHGSNLLVNLTPDTRGLIPDAEVKRMRNFGAEIKRRLDKPNAIPVIRNFAVYRPAR